ncbi:MAG TPA: SRPBCC family protein [Pseudolabrys sp.]|nr:SRPBCC family protein [Pseudolabrys sp.]
MAKSYYSTVFDQPADQVWRTIRDFNNYTVWVDGAGESEIEDGKTGDTVGAVRNVLYGGGRRRQRLLALSDTERSQTYTFEGAAPMPVWNFEATIRVTPVIDGDRAFIEWSANFDCDAESYDMRVMFFRDAFAEWLQSLRRHLDGIKQPLPSRAA